MSRTRPTLEMFLEEVARLSSLPICLYDLSYFTQKSPQLIVPDELRFHVSPLCLKVKSNPDAWRKCIEIEYTRASLADENAQSDEALLHTCHAGLTDMIIPLHRGQQQIGALYLGQAVAHSAARQRRILARLAKTYGFSLEELEEISATQPRLSRARLKKHALLLKLLREYIESAEKLAPRTGSTPDEGGGLRRTMALEDVPTWVLDEIYPQSGAVKKALGILRANYWKKITLSGVSREVGLSQSHFSRRFQLETGMSFRACLLKTRIAAARFLLKKTDYSVGEVAQMLGYASTPAFVRAFKFDSHITPRKFVRVQAFPTFKSASEENPTRKSNKSNVRKSAKAPKGKTAAKSVNFSR